MDIAVIGATGRTGREIVRQGLARGHEIRALVRHPDALPPSPRLRPTVADALDPAAVDDGLAGAQAVVSALGVATGRTPTRLYSQGTANLLAAMARHAIPRLIVVSAAPAGPRAEQGWLERRIAMPLLELAFGATYADMRRMEAALTASDAGIDWVALRPPRLVARPALGAYRMLATPVPGGRTLTCADLAAAALDLSECAQPSRRPLYIAN